MNKILKYTLFLISFTPLLVDNLIVYPFTSVKIIFFRTVLTLISILFISCFIFIDKFRNDILHKFKIFLKTPLFISISSFIFLIGASSLFAVDKYTAFWGTLERGEGFVSFVYYFIFLNFLILFFEKKDWLNFFKLNILVSIIVLVKESYQFFILGLGRPDSFFGNPTFLAGYLIFSIIFSFLVFSQSKSKFWKYFSVFSVIFSVFGIFIAETRGTILGLAVGFVAFLIYAIVKGKNVNYKKFNLRKVSIIVLSLIVIFSALFISTRRNEVWQKVPGLSRVAVISFNDASTSTRLLNQKISLKSIDPSNNSLKYLIFGYGQDNFGYVYGKYFNPVQFEDEMAWFDRSHNKFLDVLVMNGILGLLVYLSIFVLFISILLKNKDFSWTTAGLLLGIVAYLVHLFFIFDQITTYIQLFVIFAFLIYVNYEGSIIKDKIIKNHIIGIILLFVSIILSLFIYFKNDIITYIQIKNFVFLLNNGKASFILKKIDSSLYPFTIAQTDIRKKMLLMTEKNFDKNDKSMVDLAILSLEKGIEYSNHNPFDFVFKMKLANDFTSKGKKLNNTDFLLKGEKYYREITLYSPDRPDFNYMFAVNLFYQKKNEESLKYFEKSFNLSEKYYEKNKENVLKMYPIFLKYFIENKNLENLKIVSDRLSKENYEGSEMLKKLINYIEKTDTWPPVRFD